MKIVVWSIILITSLSINLRADWTNIRNSSYTAEGEIYLQYESSLQTDYDHQVSYFLDNEWIDNISVHIGTATYQTVIPFPNTESLPLSFRIESDNEILLIPGYGVEQPVSLQELTILSEYQRNLEIPDHLNIAGERMLFSEDNLYFSFTNFGGGFPVSGGTFGPFYTYTITLWPAVAGAPDFVYILLYTVNLAPYINPGLYKIDVATDDMTQIGTINYQIDQNNDTIYLSCLRADLMNDPDFAGSYSTDQGLIVSSLTQKIEDFGATITIMDEGSYHSLYLNPHFLEPFTNNLPQISNINVDYSDDLVLITLDYFDPDGHFPLISEVRFDVEQNVEMVTDSYDYSETVTFSCQYNGNWSSGLIRFSDNLTDIVEQSIFNSIHLEIITPLPNSVQIFPNPFISSINQDGGLNLRINDGGFIDIEIFNLKGQRVFVQKNSSIIAEQLTIPQDILSKSLPTSGVYLLKITLKNNLLQIKDTLTDKFIFIR